MGRERRKMLGVQKRAKVGVAAADSLPSHSCSGYALFLDVLRTSTSTPLGFAGSLDAYLAGKRKYNGETSGKRQCLD